MNRRLISSGIHPAFNDDHWLVTGLLCFQAPDWWNKQESYENNQSSKTIISLLFLLFPPLCSASSPHPPQSTKHLPHAVSLVLYTFIWSLFNHARSGLWQMRWFMPNVKIHYRQAKSAHLKLVKCIAANHGRACGLQKTLQTWCLRF